MRLSPVPPQRMAPPAIPQDVPVYRVTDEKGFFADNTLFPQDTIIGWPDAPNPNMEPMNELAHEAMKEYLGQLDAHGREWAKREKRSYVSQLDAYKAKTEATTDNTNRTVFVVGAKEETPLLGNKRPGRPKAIKVDMEAQSAPITNMKGKFSFEKAGKDAVNKADGNI